MIVKRHIVLSALLAMILATGARGEENKGEPVLLISQSQFFDDPVTGKPKPGPARLVIARPAEGGWSEEVLEDPDSNVFHKALIFREGENSLLTIGAMKAALKHWGKKEGKWEAVTLWAPSFGGKFDRLRDVEVGDVTGDGQEEIVVATHDQGVVGVLRKQEGKWTPEEIDRETGTFVHEVEIGDVDNDGMNEFFVTPSRPNPATFESQPGKIVMYRWDGKGFKKTTVDEPENTHAKEILLADIEDDGTSTLFAAVEAQTRKEGGKLKTLHPVRIRRYALRDGKWVGEDIATLDDRQCRFLACGDVDGDGEKELIAAAMKSGLWLLKEAPGGKWEKSLIDADSSGYEHAAYLKDLDGDGADEIYVASDGQREIRRYRRKGETFEKDVLLPIPKSIITWNVVADRL